MLKLSALFSRKSAQSQDKNALRKGLRFERLEDRQLLTASPNDFGPVYEADDAAAVAPNEVENEDIDLGDVNIIAPTCLYVTGYNASAQKATIVWKDNAKNETGYRLEYSSDGGETWRLTTDFEANTSSCFTYSLKADTDYMFRICAFNDEGTSDWKVVEFSTAQNLTPPTALKVADYDAASQKATLTWKDNANDETGYLLQYSSDGGQTWRLPMNFDADSTSAVTYSLKADTDYTFRLCAVRDGVRSQWKTVEFSTVIDQSNDVEEIEAEVASIIAPTCLYVTGYNASAQKATIVWKDNAKNETGYRLQYSSDGGETWRLTTDFEANTSSCYTYSLKADTDYMFRICAFNEETTSDWKVVEFSTAQNLTAPTALKVADYDAASQKATLTWKDNARDETGYLLQYSSDGGQTWRLPMNFDADSTSAVTYSLKEDTDYTFRVCAVRDGVRSQWKTVEFSTVIDQANDVDLVEEAEAPSIIAPTCLYVTGYNASAQKATIVWKDNAKNETGYRLQYSSDGGESWRLVTNFEADTTSCVTYSLKAETDYMFRICAFNDEATSDWKIVEFSTVQNLTAPTALKIVDYDAAAQKVTLSWKDNAADETGYLLQYSSDGGQTWRLPMNFDADTTSCVTYSLKDDTDYTFRLCSVRDGVRSQWKEIEFSTAIDQAFEDLDPSDLEV